MTRIQDSSSESVTESSTWWWSLIIQPHNTCHPSIPFGKTLPTAFSLSKIEGTIALPNHYIERHILRIQSNSHVTFPFSFPLILIGSLLPNMEEENQPPMISKISSVVPATSRSDENTAWHLSHVDLLVKLHYIRAVYFFINDAAQGLSIYDLKKPMFPLLDHFTHLSGRIRISESGRPFVKCNDAGVRIAESHRDITLQEWFHKNGYSIEDLVHNHVIGPDLGFSPLVFVKFTWFKCGGLCVGLSWSHILGDAFAAFNFITKWSQILEGQTHMPPKSLHMPNHYETKFPHNSLSMNPVFAKKAKAVEEHWLAATDTKMVTHSFHVTSEQLDHLVTVTFPCDENLTVNNTFQILSALVWKCIARIRGDSEPRTVTICTYDGREIDDVPINGLVLSVVEANVVVGKSELSDLVKLIAEEKKVENCVVEKLVEESEGTEDFVVYGANLTFVDLGEAKVYEAKLNGQKPVLANCSIHGVGNQGVVSVLPAPEDDEGRMITVSLPENEIDQLKEKLGGEWGIASHPF
ncbi:hypothetical protein VNO77_31760 [Canavalia gladiata]|uniref:Uncharacterized protein n=1 Tax=Canavalia gladiata TaxID=3824 RepID=A0AAN9Q3U4_CANGL